MNSKINRKRTRAVHVAMTDTERALLDERRGAFDIREFITHAIRTCPPISPEPDAAFNNESKVEYRAFNNGRYEELEQRVRKLENLSSLLRKGKYE